MTPAEIVWPLLCLLAQVAAILGGLAMLRRNPPLPEQVAKEYATKQELEKEVEALSKRLDYLEHSLLNEVRSASASIGRIEGALGIHK